MTSAQVFFFFHKLGAQVYELGVQDNNTEGNSVKNKKISLTTI
jgi:hypothetical protein